MADAQDLKSWVRNRTCGFESRLRHQFIGHNLPLASRNPSRGGRPAIHLPCAAANSGLQPSEMEFAG